MTTPRLDEGALRRPDFAGGRAVTLCDGQPWYFPEPVLRGFTFALDAAGAPRLVRETDAGRDFDALVDARVSAETRSDELLALYAAAVHLLGRNYDLAGVDTGSILRVALAGADDADANEAVWSDVSDAVLGKKKPGGPSPTG